MASLRAASIGPGSVQSIYRKEFTVQTPQKTNSSVDSNGLEMSMKNIVTTSDVKFQYLTDWHFLVPNFKIRQMARKLRSKKKMTSFLLEIIPLGLISLSFRFSLNFVA